MGHDLGSLTESNRKRLQQLEKTLSYQFSDLHLLQKALIHSSFAFEKMEVSCSNERLEFLGDAVLDLIIGHLLLHRYSKLREGHLTKIRASLVNEQHLAKMAISLDLGSYLELGKGEEGSRGREKSSILSCAFEAVIGAVFEDGGYQVAARLVEKLFTKDLKEKREAMLQGDAKSRLQEYLQRHHNAAPVYRLMKEEGPSHQKIFSVAVLFHDRILGQGEAGSKKEAEQRAATDAFSTLESKG